MTLRIPDAALKCSPFVPAYITPEMRLCRVYNVEQGRLNGFGIFDWNPTIPPETASDGGRFDATPSDPFAYLYAAESRMGPQTAIGETLSSLVSYDPGRNRNIIPRRVVNARSYQYFNVSHEVVLADLRTKAGRAKFHAPDQVVTDTTRNITRAWGSHIRASSRDIQGFVYNSTQASSSRRKIDASFVLFSDRLPKLRFESGGKLRSLESGKGRYWVNEVLSQREVLIVGA